MGKSWYVSFYQGAHTEALDLLVNRRFSTVEARAKRLPSSKAPSNSLLLRSRPPLHPQKNRRKQKLLPRKKCLSYNSVQQQRQMASLAEPRGCEKKMSQ